MSDSAHCDPAHWRYTWDHENRMAEAATRKTKVRYRYDALGRRVARNLGGGREVTKFTYDGQDVLLDDNAGNQTKYLNGSGIDNKLRQTIGSSTSYFLGDHLGSTSGLTNSSGSITASNGYDSFGNPTDTGFPSRYQFTGREFDNFTGLQFSRARWYDPNIGRFISEDPIGFRGGDANLYGYVKNQPLIFRDSRGLFPDGDVLNPNTIRQLGPAGAALAALAGPEIAVAAGGAALIYGASQLGEAAASHPNNPLVNGRLNPFGTPFPMLPPWTPTTVSGPKCEVRPRPIPWTRSPSIPFPIDPPDDRDGCAQEWADAFTWCAENMGKPDQRKGTGGYTDLHSCARGRVSQRCGGNRIDW